MGVSIPEVVNTMIAGDVAYVVILLKPGGRNFKEEALGYALRRITTGHTLGERLGLRENHRLENILSSMQMAHFLEYTGDYQHMYLTQSGRRDLEKRLRKEYGDDIVDRLRPFAETVWQEARKYRH